MISTEFRDWGCQFQNASSLYSTYMCVRAAGRGSPAPLWGLMSKANQKLVESLFADRGDDLLRYLSSRMPSGEDAKDLAQEAYLRLLRRNRDELVRHPEAYLFRIAANLMYEHWLKNRPESDQRSFAIDPEALESNDLSVEGSVAQQQSVEALERVLRVMPPMRRQCILLQRRDGMTVKEISAKLGISIGMVKKQLAKGLVLCQEQLARYSDE